VKGILAGIGKNNPSLNNGVYVGGRWGGCEDGNRGKRSVFCGSVNLKGKSGADWGKGKSCEIVGLN